MTTTLVVEHLDVIDQRHLGVVVARKPLGLLLLHGREETLDHGIVIAVAAPTHAARNAAGREVLTCLEFFGPAEA